MTVGERSRRLLFRLAFCVAVLAIAVWLLHRHAASLRIPVLEVINDLDEPATVTVHLSPSAHEPPQTYILEPGESVLATAHAERLPSRIVVVLLSAGGRAAGRRIIDGPVGKKLSISDLKLPEERSATAPQP